MGCLAGNCGLPGLTYLKGLLLATPTGKTITLTTFVTQLPLMADASQGCKGVAITVYAGQANHECCAACSVLFKLLFLPQVQWDT